MRKLLIEKDVYLPEENHHEPMLIPVTRTIPILKIFDGSVKIRTKRLHWSMWKQPIGNFNKLTCTACPDSAKCEYAFDDYNTDGDCLASK